MIVALDGPAGAGKSTVARAVAERTGRRYLDTGAMYRAVALAALEQGIPADDGAALSRMLEGLELEVNGDLVTIDGRDVSHRIRERDVTEMSPAVASHPGVRAALVARQRRSAADGEVIIEGRDIGSRVAPDARVKIFLTAALEERARRRCEQLGLPATEDNLEAQRRAIEARDEADSTREESPLVRASDAIVLDTTGMSFEAVVDEVVRIIEEAG